MEDENIYDKIEDVLGHSPENISILEEQIDIDLQVEYFEFARELKKNPDNAEIPELSEKLFDCKFPAEGKKRLLAQLAASEEVEAYRAIESYLDNSDAELRDWAVLAFQESRMLIQSRLLDEDQVFISTGLGGRGSGLRYFVVLVNSYGEQFSELQQKLVRTEFEYHLKKYGAEAEEICFMSDYCSLLAVLPIRVPVRDVFRESIAECNQYGGFLSEKVIVTNIRKLSYEEIKEFISKQNDE